MQIRHERDSDHALISVLTYTVFTGHPQHAPGALPTEHEIIDRVRAAGALALSLVAEEDGDIIGHVAFSEVLIAGEHVCWYGLGPVSVHPSRQRQGIGSALIREGISRLRERGARGIALVGDAGYYGRFGFQADPDLVLEGVPPEHFLVLPLELPKPGGNVTFHAAFA